MFRSETSIPISIPSGGTLQVKLVMQNRQEGGFQQPATLYVEVEGRLIEKSVTLQGQVLPAPEESP